MKRSSFLAVVAVLSITAQGFADTLTPAQMYIAPGSLPEGEYTYEQQPTGYVAPFSGVQRLQVLPMLTADAESYYYSPGTDYTGDITGSVGSITFLRPGPYHVLATYLDGSTEIRDYSIDCDWHEPTINGPRDNPNRPKPDGGDMVVVNQSRFNVTYTADAYTGNPNVVSNLSTWDDVTAYLTSDNVKDKHVELQGHGEPGKFYWNGACVLDVNAPGFQPWLDSLKGHVNKLTFISCSVGGGDPGAAFVGTVYNTLGGSGAYTKPIECTWDATNGYVWSTVKGCEYVVPEPASVLMLLLGAAALHRRRAA